MSDNKERIYRINFQNKGEVYEIFAKHISHGDIFGFLAVEEIIFGENSAVVVDPAEERLRTEFKDVSCTFIPMHNINRIDEVEKTGQAKISTLKTDGNVTHFPNPIYTPTPRMES
tara:strand:- start:7363 stop:7707 length:345 start_codon:yes stop_codon:yes gene_type:complete